MDNVPSKAISSKREAQRISIFIQLLYITHYCMYIIDDTLINHFKNLPSRFIFCIFFCYYRAPFFNQFVIFAFNDSICAFCSNTIIFHRYNLRIFFGLRSLHTCERIRTQHIRDNVCECVGGLVCIFVFIEWSIRINVVYVNCDR